MARELEIPRGERAATGATGADRAQQRVALRQCRDIGAAGADAGRPQRGDHLVHVGAPQRRGAEHEIEPVGEEDGDERTSARVGQLVDGGAVDLQPLRLARLETDGDPVRVAVTLGVELQPRDAGAEAHDLALVAGPARAAGAGEVDRLEQVRLARPVGARDHGQPRAQPHLRRLVGAEVANGEAGDPHDGAPPTRSAGSASAGTGTRCRLRPRSILAAAGRSA